MKIDIDQYGKIDGGVVYEVKKGMSIGNHNELVSLNVEMTSKLDKKEHKEQMISLGGVERKYVVTPNLGNIWPVSVKFC